MSRLVSAEELLVLLNWNTAPIFIATILLKLIFFKLLGWRQLAWLLSIINIFRFTLIPHCTYFLLVRKIMLFGPASVRSYKIGVFGNIWLVGNAVFSETALRIFLIFCIKLGDYKGRKVKEPNFWKKFLIWRYSWKRLQISPKSDVQLFSYNSPVQSMYSCFIWKKIVITQSDTGHWFYASTYAKSLPLIWKSSYYAI